MDNTQNKDSKHSINCQSAIVLLMIKENGMKAFLEINANPEFLKDKTKEEIISNLDYELFETEICNWIESIISEKLVDDVQLKNALNLYKTTLQAKERRISQGTSPVPGTDGKLILLVKPFTKEFEGTYDLKNKYQKHFDIISNTACIARIYPPKPGQDGLDVFNKPIPFQPGTELDITLSPNLKIQESNNNYKEIISCDDGYIINTALGKKITLTLETTLKFQKGVDHKTGSVAFINSVYINGDVKEGFAVEAVNDITIVGNTNQSNIQSKRGSIEISGIVLDEDISEESIKDFLISGSNTQHSIIAAKSFKAKELQNAKVFAGENIEISGSVIRSQVYSSSIVICKKAVFASKISTACGLEVNQLGNQSNILTIVEFLNPVEAGIDFINKKQINDRYKEKLKKLELFIGPYIQDKNKLARLTTDHKNKIKAAINELNSITSKITNLEKEMTDLRQASQNYKFSQLNVLDKCYIGVSILAADQTYEFKENKFSRFSLIFDWELKEFKMTEYSPIKCELI